LLLDETIHNAKDGDLNTTYISDNNIAARFNVHRTTPWRWVNNDPTFPKPVKLSAGCTRWVLADIEAWEASRATVSK
jgi:predicted DNA-binding transcriptional regulator AlpA